MNLMIKIKNLSKVFKGELLSSPVTALDQLNFQLSAKKMTGLLGANGAGKTTLIKIIMDFIRPSAGEVIFDSTLGQGKKEIFSQIGLMPEHPYFYPHLTGDEFLNYLGALSGLEKEKLNQQKQTWGGGNSPLTMLFPARLKHIPKECFSAWV
jgi:ABC-2 type transport system ATP-binding protein